MHHSSRKAFAGLFLLFTMLVATPALALDPVYTGVFSSKALDGYDTVAYFTEGKAVKGRSEFQTEYQGATWYFSTQAHLDSFVANPQQYAPQYGGYCAWAISQGYDASADPEQWSIVDGKLYVNYNAEIKARWEANTRDFIEKADRNWPGLLEG